MAELFDFVDVIFQRLLEMLFLKVNTNYSIRNYFHFTVAVAVRKDRLEGLRVQMRDFDNCLFAFKFDFVDLKLLVKQNLAFSYIVISFKLLHILLDTSYVFLVSLNLLVRLLVIIYPKEDSDLVGAVCEIHLDIVPKCEVTNIISAYIILFYTIEEISRIDKLHPLVKGITLDSFFHLESSPNVFVNHLL